MLNDSNMVPSEHIENIMANAPTKTMTVFGNTTVVVMRLPNGFTITEASGCIDPANYSEEVGREICMRKIKDRIWMLEGYVGANEFAEK